MEKVKLNSFIIKILELKSEKPKETVTCTQCDTDKDVNWFCVDCRIELCGVCQKGHTKIPTLKHHSIVSLDSCVEERVIDELVMCGIHNDRVVEANCKTCETLMCLLCKEESHLCHETEMVSGT